MEQRYPKLQTASGTLELVQEKRITREEKGKVKPYYQDSAVTIYHGDCRDVLPSLPVAVFDLLLTDPPYGIGEARGANKSRTNKAKATDYGIASWDDAPVDASLLTLVRSKATKQIIFGGNYFSLPPSRCWLVWDKQTTGDFADCELAWTNLDMAVRRLRYLWSGFWQEKMGVHKEQRWHPTQKPLDVMAWCIRLAGSGVGSILDPFMGSGTILRAAKDAGKTAIGIEIEERYCEVAAKRMSQEVLFGAA